MAGQLMLAVTHPRCRQPLLPQWAGELDRCRLPNARWIDAPGEADPQLAALLARRRVQAVWSEDSDMIPLTYGIPGAKVLFGRLRWSADQGCWCLWELDVAEVVKGLYGKITPQQLCMVRRVRTGAVPRVWQPGQPTWVSVVAMAACAVRRRAQRLPALTGSPAHTAVPCARRRSPLPAPTTAVACPSSARTMRWSSASTPSTSTT